jgi:hypothetical protein
MKMMIESTAAKRGRFTKNFEKDMRVVLELRGGDVFGDPSAIRERGKGGGDHRGGRRTPRVAVGAEITPIQPFPGTGKARSQFWRIGLSTWAS